MWVDPFTVLGLISIPFFISNLLTLIGFLLAAYFSFRYVLSFFEDRKKPLSWLLIIVGLTSFCFSEVGQFMMPYMATPSALVAIVVLAVQSVGIIMIALGTIMLFREVTM